MSKNYEVYFTNPDSPMFLEQWLENLLQDNRELVTFSEGYWIFRIVEPLSTMECTTDNAIKSDEIIKRLKEDGMNLSLKAENELAEWKQVASMLADALCDANSERLPMSWEDASESDPAWIAYVNLRDRSKE